jgi:hypothetical protein
LRFVGASKSLRVELLIKMLEELETDNPIVGTSIKSNGGGSFGWLLAVNTVDAVWVEDFVHTEPR